MKAPYKNHHCTCIKIGSAGIMIEGPAGSGKSSLALGMLEAAARRDISQGMICDDQAYLEVADNCLWASVPNSIAGKIEIHGFGIVDTHHLKRGKIDLVCKLVDQVDMSRHPDTAFCKRSGVQIEYVCVPRQHETQSVRILLGKLGLPLLAHTINLEKA